ncbi:MAG: hypothetical protein IJB14_00250, partial [Firmicutes bacterium]|nr:hypothetical protein [Bacillota bacterium]
VLDAAGFDIPVVGMVKDDKHRTRALVYRKGQAIAGGVPEALYEEIPLAGKNMLYKYIGRMQEEVHRFAIEYHRKVRSKNAELSVLDEIQGIGPARRAALLKHFKSVDAVKAASLSEIEEVQGMTTAAAMSVWSFFHKT